MLRAANASGDPRALAVRLMLRLGLRRGEALGLHWSDVDLERGVVTVSHQLQRVPDAGDPGRTVLARVAPKTSGSIRFLQVDPSLLEVLRQLIDGSGWPSGPDDFVVSATRDTPMTPTPRRRCSAGSVTRSGSCAHRTGSGTPRRR